MSEIKKMELLSFYFMMLFCVVANAQTPQNPTTAFDPIQLLSNSLTGRVSSLTYAAVKDLTIRPFRKRPPALLYQVEFDNTIFNISLLQNIGLTSPGCLIHHYDTNGRKSLGPCNRQKYECFYTGRSDSHNDSWVAADVCNGLKGVLSIGNLNYYFDPMHSNATSINGVHVHTVYRFHGDKRICPVNDFVGQIARQSYNGRKRREYTDQSETKYVETRVVIDPYMVSYHGSPSSAEHYAYMAFNIANKVFAHKSLGQLVQLVISDMYVIEDFTHELSSRLTNDADHSLKELCDWQYLQERSFDANVLFTRRNIRSKGMESVTGLAYTKGMCTKRTNCVVVEDQGPIVGITVAHEIGHLLGMKHDVDETGIMNSGGWSGDEAFKWSNSSAKDFYEFATQKPDALWCIRNRPFGLESKVNSILDPPGVMYSADVQCKLMHDSSYIFKTPYNASQDVCRNLPCGTLGSSIITLASAPMMDGTDCYNNGSWCMMGRCVPIDPKMASRIQPVHGVWSEWSQYTTCSRTCDGGITTRIRSCRNPMSQFGGKDCPGSNKDVKLCNLEACSTAVGYDDRQRQCLTHNEPNVTFVPVCNSGTCSFALCLANATSQTCFREVAYASGTQCTINHSPYNRCVNGQCMSFGCDGKWNSSVQYDKCGVCGGDNSTCDRHTGTYDEDGIYRHYVDVVTIPKGSLSITVIKRHYYYVLSVSVNGTRLFNNDGNRSASFDRTIQGIHIMYQTKPERIDIVSPIPQDIVIQMNRTLSMAYVMSPGISYTYYTPRLVMEYAWATIENRSCSRPCGIGEQKDNIRCMTRSGHYVEDMMCGIDTKPREIVKSCRTNVCPPRWDMSDWSDCSEPCGYGKKTRNVTCVMELDDGSIVYVNKSRCQLNSGHPPYESLCYSKCLGIWQYGNWSECSTTCGEGYRYRSVTCKALIHDRLYTLQDKECDQKHRPDEVSTCYPGPCYFTNSTNCVDNSTTCASYYSIGAEVCGKPNSANKCAKTCGVCTDTNCYDHPVCDTLRISDCRRYNTTMMVWLFQNCPQKCGVCDDKNRCFDLSTCNMYERKYCDDPSYIRWMYRNCPQSCGVCRDCMDCSAYNKVDCTNPNNVNFMKAYCAKTCNLC